jgi:hypothetical protein
MTPHGFGFSREGRQAAWKALEEEPPRGPDCALTLELLDLARDRLEEPDRARVRGHLEGCPRCRQRLDAQKSALARLQQARAATPAESTVAGVAAAFARRRRSAWQGTVDPAALLHCDSPDQEHEVEVRLAAPEKDLVLPGFLRWSRSDRGAGPWYVSLRIPRPAQAAAQASWEELADRDIDLTLTDERDQRSWSVSTELAVMSAGAGATGSALISRPEEVSLEQPGVVKAVRLLPGQRRPRYELS